jgi:hypothetical protein
VKVEDDTVDESMSSEKVAVTLVLGATSVAPSRGSTLLIVGAVVSTVQSRLAGVESVPEELVALTSKWCCPSLRPE